MKTLDTNEWTFDREAVYFTEGHSLSAARSRMDGSCGNSRSTATVPGESGEAEIIW